MLLIPFTFTGVFNPLSLSPALWFDGADSSTLFDATTGGSLVAADGAVARWEDKSGNARHATQTNSSFRPLRKTGIQNSLGMLRFDGVDDQFKFPSADSFFNNTSPLSVFAVTKNMIVTAPEYGVVIAKRVGSFNSMGCCPQYYPNAGLEVSTDIFAPGGVRYGSTGVQANPNIMEWHWSNWSTHKSNGNTRLALNGVEVSGTAYGSKPTTITSGQGTIGSFIPDATGLPCLLADIGEILVYPSQLFAINRLMVRTYLSQKWNIAI